ncbi:UTP--glucose-1-phosphate uridylyltransferase isoform X2 [Salvelinus sp. IW2-2015]
MAEFQEKLRLQHETSMHKELEKLLTTAKGAEQEISKKDFEGFKNLFHRFLQVKGPSVKWDKIHKPPEDLVSSSVLTLVVYTPQAGSSGIRYLHKKLQDFVIQISLCLKMVPFLTIGNPLFLQVQTYFHVAPLVQGIV